jgi:hypothetical protein
VKRCYSCGETKPLELFSRHRSRSDGRKAECKRCTKIDWAKRRCQSPEKEQARRRRRRLRLYGLTPAAYDALLEAQGGGCAVCGAPPDSVRAAGRALAVDHDHSCCLAAGHADARTCGQCVRGLLCRTCNQLVGSLEREPGLLASIAAYLEGTASAPVA